MDHPIRRTSLLLIFGYLIITRNALVIMKTKKAWTLKLPKSCQTYPKVDKDFRQVARANAVVHKI